MKREEEIKKAAKQRADQYSHPLQWNDVYNAFVCGVNWADKHINVNFVFLIWTFTGWLLAVLMFFVVLFK